MPGFFNVLGEQRRHKGPRFNVSSERLLVILLAGGLEPTYSVGTRSIVFTSPTLYLLS